MLYEAFGKLHVLFDEQQVTEKFRKREFVVEIEDGNYPQYVKFQLTQDKCSALNSFQKGDKIKVVFGLSGREGKSRDGNTVYFTNLGAWKLEKIDGGAPAAAPSRAAAASSSDAPAPDDDDIPF
jgi:single-strand DNA-binding protein